METRRLATFEQGIAFHKLALTATATFGPWVCRHFMVGKMRREIARDLPAVVAGQGALREAAVLAENHCRLCRKCTLGRK